MRARDNPFASERLARLGYRPQEVSIDALLDRLERLRYRGAIVGHHGAGKTTLLAALAPRLVDRGFVVHRLRLDVEHPRLAGPERAALRQHGPRDVVLLDGAEQLSRLDWWRLRRAAARAGGLIITTHAPGRLPTALRCETSVELLVELVEELAPGQHPPAELRALHELHAGNLRDVLWTLYDRQAGRGGSADGG